MGVFMKKIIKIIAIVSIIFNFSCSKDKQQKNNEGEKFIKSYEIFVEKYVEIEKKYQNLYPLQHKKADEFKKYKEMRFKLKKIDNWMDQKIKLEKEGKLSEEQKKKFWELFKLKASSITKDQKK